VKEDWIEGASNPIMALGALSQGGLVRLKKPFMNVHFVGTETADVWRGYMDGAVRSGERGAREISSFVKVQGLIVDLSIR
jgi:monoamine oxidase